MVMLTSTQTVRTGQRIKALLARVNGQQVKVLDIRNVCDTDPAKSYMVADVQLTNCLPFSVPLADLQNVYALIEQVIE